MVAVSSQGGGGSSSGGDGGKDWVGALNYEWNGNELWRFGLLLGLILVTLVFGRSVRYVLRRAAKRLREKTGLELLGMFLDCVSRPGALVIFALGIYVSRSCFEFSLIEGAEGFSEKTFKLWGKISYALLIGAAAYFLYRLVDIVEHYLRRWTSRTETKLDDMLVPITRKGLRIFIVVVSGMFIADNILEQDIGTILAAAGIGGLAFALAAKDTIANFFGSVTIFADRPFQVGERIRVGGFDGPVEEVGLRSTRVRTLTGHQVSVPNSLIVNEIVENIGRRPYIRRLANITISYETSVEKVARAVAIVKEVLGAVEEINGDAELPPRVFFNEFNDWSLNLLVLYWFKPPDYWRFQAVNERVNLAIMREFAAEGIEFAFPSQTLYLKKGKD